MSLLTKIIIKSCHNNDTCTTTKGQKIRLACIDKFELKGSKAKPIKAKNILNNLVANKQTSVIRITKNRYGRRVD